MKFFRALWYRWHDWRSKDVPFARQRVDAMTLLPRIKEADRMRTKARVHAKCRNLADWIRKHDSRRRA